MTLLESDAAYYFTILLPITMTPMEGSDSIIQGLVLETYPAPKGEAKGSIDWFDKVEARQRSMEIKEVPKTLEKSMTFFVVDGPITHFQYVDLDVYNKLVRKLLPQAPSLSSDDDVQAYLKRLNPYE